MRIPAGRSGQWPRMARSGRWHGCLALLAGALPALAFPAPALWWLAGVGLVPWLLLIRSAGSGRRAALDGWLGGTGYMLAVHHWLMPSLHVFILVLAALLGLLWAPWGLLVFRMLGGPVSAAAVVCAVVVVPCGWLMIELVRSWEALGGPWGLLGASQWQVAPALRVASVGGVWLVSLVVVAVNTAVALLIVASAARAVAAVGLAVCGLAVGAMAKWAPQPEESGVARIAVVQPGVFTGVDSAERRLAVSERLTGSLAGRDLDLVVWGESSVGVDLAARPDVTARIAALSRRVGADVLVNVDARQTDRSGRTGIFKSAVLVGPGGLTGDRYDKMRLVPFGEYIPARSALGWVVSMGRAAGEDRLRGTRQVTMSLPRGRRRERTARRAADLLRVRVPRHEPPAHPGRRPAADRPVVDLLVPARLGARAACLARGAAGRRERPPGGARHAHRRQHGVRTAGRAGRGSARYGRERGRRVRCTTGDGHHSLCAAGRLAGAGGGGCAGPVLRPYRGWCVPEAQGT
ncbi:apolipoprotein N-acyltransferase [Streptomyces sp. TE3672]